MKGQWLGTYSGSIDGMLMINIDETKNNYEGVAYLFPRDKKFPSSVAYISTANKKNKQEAMAYVNAVDPRTRFQCSWDEIKDLYEPDIVHSTEAKIKFNKVKNKLHFDAITNIGVTVNAILEKPSETDSSKIVGKEMSWSKFKTYVSKLSKSRYLFRGQQKPWRLRTSFHRRGRYRISEFTNKDVKQLHQRLSAITSHYFDLNVPNQNGSFFNLLQHHGYPTPLLDWSYSPYVSAFFAFRDWSIKYSGDEHARIYIFNNEAWQKNNEQLQYLDPPFPHLSVMEFIAIDNPRLVPQQAVTTVTNLDDIEDYLLQKEIRENEQYIQAIDIPAKEREVAMRDLRFMGITAGSMFPSIDGVCEELRECNFEE